jgi:hypothetical protein
VVWGMVMYIRWIVDGYATFDVHLGRAPHFFDTKATFGTEVPTLFVKNRKFFILDPSKGSSEYDDYNRQSANETTTAMHRLLATSDDGLQVLRDHFRKPASSKEQKRS